MEADETRDRSQLISPRWHFAIFLFFQVAMAVNGGSTLRRITAADDPEAMQARLMWYYAMIIAWEWMQFAYVWWGVRRRGVSLRELVGGSWDSPWDLVKDVGIGLAFWFLWMFGLILFTVATGIAQESPNEVRLMTPSTALGLVWWAAISVSAGICEEFVYRGYLQRQILAMSGRRGVAILGQGVVFGVIHSYQGMFAVGVITVMGICFGLLAAWRRSLRPGIIAHAWYDGVIGLLMYLASKLRAY